MICQNINQEQKYQIISDIEKYLKKQKLIQLRRVDQKERVRRNDIDDLAILREIAKNEIVIEFDTDNILRVKALVKKVIKRLILNNYNFCVFDHKGRSPHIHIYNIQGLEEQPDDVRSQYKRLFLKKISPFNETDVGINTSRTHPIAMENRKHFKHGNIKELIFMKGSIVNYLDLKLLNKACKECEKIRNEVNNNKIDDWFWLVNMFNKEVFKEGERNNILFKNVAITMANNNINPEMIRRTIEEKYPLKHCFNTFMGWYKWATNSNRVVSFIELQKFFDIQEKNFGVMYNEYFRKFS